MEPHGVVGVTDHTARKHRSKSKRHKRRHKHHHHKRRHGHDRPPLSPPVPQHASNDHGGALSRAAAAATGGFHRPRAHDETLARANAPPRASAAAFERAGSYADLDRSASHAVGGARAQQHARVDGNQIPAAGHLVPSPVLCWRIRIQHVAIGIVVAAMVALSVTAVSLGTRRPALPSMRIPSRTYMTWAHTYGEATNRRFGLLGALAVARLTGRTLVLPTDLDTEAYVTLDYAGLRKEGISVVSEREFRHSIVPAMQPKFSTTDVIISMVGRCSSLAAPAHGT